MYFKGQGVKKDYNEAFYYFTKTAEQGHVKAHYNLGVMYENGLEVAQDFGKAFEWYEKATNEGYEGAQFRIFIVKFKNIISWFKTKFNIN